MSLTDRDLADAVTGGEVTSSVDVATQAADAVSTQVAPELAWSSEDGDDEVVGSAAHSWRLAAELAVGVLIICAVVAVLLLLNRSNGGAIRAHTPPATTSQASGPAYCAPGRNSDPGCLPVVKGGGTVPASPPPVGAPTASPPTATLLVRADDQNFLAMLAVDGISPPDTAISRAHVIAAAADVCAMAKRGYTPGYMESWLVPPKGMFTQNQAEAFVADAVAAYCPHAAIKPDAAATPAPRLASPQPADLDQRYLADLNAGGIAISDVGVVTQGAHEICSALAAGKSKESIAADVMAGNHTLTAGNAATVVSSAVAVYCPQYGGSA